MLASYRRRALAVAALMVAGVAGCDDSPSRPAQAPGDAPPPEVEVVTIAAQRLPVSAELPGRTAAFRVAEIRPQVDGIVRERLFPEGGVVTAGPPLSRIYSNPYEAVLAAAEAAFQQAYQKSTRLTSSHSCASRMPSSA